MGTAVMHLVPSNSQPDIFQQPHITLFPVFTLRRFHKITVPRRHTKEQARRRHLGTRQALTRHIGSVPTS